MKEMIALPRGLKSTEDATRLSILVPNEEYEGFKVLARMKKIPIGDYAVSLIQREVANYQEILSEYQAVASKLNPQN